MTWALLQAQALAQLMAARLAQLMAARLAQLPAARLAQLPAALPARGLEPARDAAQRQQRNRHDGGDSADV